MMMLHTGLKFAHDLLQVVTQISQSCNIDLSQSIHVFVKLLRVFLAPFQVQTKGRQKILNHVEYRIDMQNAFHVACCRNRKWCILLNWTSQLNWPRSIPFDIRWNFQLLKSRYDLNEITFARILLYISMYSSSQWWPCKNWPSKIQKEKHNQRHFEKCSHFIFREICDFSKYFKSLVIKSVITKRRQLLVRTKNLYTYEYTNSSSFLPRWPILTWHALQVLTFICF